MASQIYTRKIYGTASSTTNGVATVTVPKAGILRAVQWAMKWNNITDNAAAVVELSLASATEIAVNAAQQCISEIAFYSNFVTSGLMLGNGLLYVPVHVPLTQGQLIYMHAVIVGTGDITGGAVLWLS